jgi:hypothetical protein
LLLSEPVSLLKPCKILLQDIHLAHHVLMCSCLVQQPGSIYPRCYNQLVSHCLVIPIQDWLTQVSATAVDATKRTPWNDEVCFGCRKKQNTP